MPRLIQRVKEIQMVTIAKLSNYQLNFHKVGRDGSGKASINYTGRIEDEVWGTICNMSKEGKKLLDDCEGVGSHYLEKKVTLVTENGEQVEAFTYMANPTKVKEGLMPFHWYKNYVLAGASQLNFPAHYLQQLIKVDSKPDPDQKRVRQNRIIV